MDSHLKAEELGQSKYYLGHIDAYKTLFEGELIEAWINE